MSHSPAIDINDPERLRRTPAQYMTGHFSSHRQEVGPVDLTRSRQHGVMNPRGCAECGGPVFRENRGGPVLLHREHCSIPPRPRMWPKQPANLEPFKR